jgi:hypothetical protein
MGPHPIGEGREGEGAASAFLQFHPFRTGLLNEDQHAFQMVTNVGVGNTERGVAVQGQPFVPDGVPFNGGVVGEAVEFVN